MIKINPINIFQPGYVPKNFLPGFSKTNPVNLPSAAAAIAVFVVLPNEGETAVYGSNPALF